MGNTVPIFDVLSIVNAAHAGNDSTLFLHRKICISYCASFLWLRWPNILIVHRLLGWKPGPCQNVVPWSRKEFKRGSSLCGTKARARDHDDHVVPGSQPLNDTYGGEEGVKCYGCGIILQTDDPEACGYVPVEKFEEKARHRQFDQLICTRCQSLSHGAMIPGVEDFAQKVDYEKEGQNNVNMKRLATPQQLRIELQRVRESRALIVLLIDLLDCSGTLLSKVRDLVGKNPIVAIGTKVDLLPKDVELGDRFYDWFEDALAFKKTSVIGMHMVSSKTKKGIAEAAADIKQLRLGRDVYIMGAANVGKSAFVRAFVKEMSSMTSRQYDPLAISKSKRLPVESSMPGTTLSSIPLDVFASGGTLFDTPGLHLHHRLPHILTPEENKEIHPKKRLQGYVPPLPENVMNNGDFHACYSWGGIVRVHVLDCPIGTGLTFFGPPCLRVEAFEFETAKILRSDNRNDENASENGFASESVAARGGLHVARKMDIKIPRSREQCSIADIAISGVPGWINIGSCQHENKSKIRVIVEAPVGIEAFVRPPMPLKADHRH